MPLWNWFSVPAVSAQAEDEEEELVDPQDVLREQCQPHCASWKEKLETCNERVRSRSQTAETCVEEVIDFLHCMDHCVVKDLFSKLK
ncbi:Cytochrome b-c1 complex subunit 6-like, mitochondrial [Nesidiocoris tenuis]|uniref:Cytochrome b-c1 complex subunit 6 n=1 Tax=Nesidiocoris tenuis TaxID=355587 RepID=A0ABN7AY80_9HEMI|nr:Cytochrome b-c1 complex subunit 6-like, mitochondrial [Nesidiocoris tenuis]